MITTAEHLYRAVLAYGENDLARARDELVQAVAREPENPLYREAAHYLERSQRDGKQNVYATGDAFAAFVRGGGNIPLYNATSAALRNIYKECAAPAVLDIGAGDGRALLPALTRKVARLDLVEPSAAMLARLRAELDARQVPYRAFNDTLQEFVQDPDASASSEWDVMQATFSLQSIPPDERAPLLKWLCAHGKRLLIAEFDVPTFSDPFGRDRVHYILERFPRGLAEYADDGGYVAQGFMMPVMFGYFDRTAARVNYEQPITAWADECHRAGFKSVAVRRLYDYWWAPAYLVDAER